MASSHEPANKAIRIDKWLWYARFFKSRTLAGQFCNGGKVRINSETVSKAHTQIRPGDVLTFVKAGHVRVIEVAAVGTRRGPAPEARELYSDLSPPEQVREKNETAKPPGQREPGSGRPTKAQRRAIDRLKSHD